MVIVQLSLFQDTELKDPKSLTKIKWVSHDVPEEPLAPRTWSEALCATCVTFRRGWRVYRKYDVMYAGLALASLYFTVLGFHNITIG